MYTLLENHKIGPKIQFSEIFKIVNEKSMIFWEFLKSW